MRIIRYIILLFCIVLLSSCGKDEIDFIDILTIRVPFEIQAGLDPIQTHFFQENDIRTRLDELLQANNIAYEDISAIRPRFAQVVSQGIVERFDFVRVSSIEIRSQNENFIECFYIDRIPENEDAILDYIPNDVDVKNRFENTRIDTRVMIQVKRTNNATFRADLEMSFFIQ